MIGIETNEIIEELFDSLLQKYQEGLEESMKEFNLFLVVMIYFITNFIK